MKPIVSRSGRICGRGKDYYKWVSHLTPEERDAVKSGGTVLIKDDNSHWTTTPYKRVIHDGHGYTHRNYYPEESS